MNSKGPRPFRYEARGQRPLARRHFVRRVVAHFTLACGLVAVSLLFGMVGYAELEGLSWIDSFLNAAMLLGGMGPVNPPMTEAGKLFAAGYALYAGLLFLVVAGLMVGPVVHRILHRFHWDDRQ